MPKITTNTSTLQRQQQQQNDDDQTSSPEETIINHDLYSLQHHLQDNGPLSTPTSSTNSSNSGNSSNNSNNNTSHNEEEEETIQYHPISCLNCKRLHKKCSKQLPSCAQCQLKGIECKYSEPVNKKKNIELNNNISNINNIQLINQNINTNLLNNPLLNSLNNNQINNNHLSKRNVIDLYFLVISYGNPIIKRQLLEDVILNSNSINANSNSTSQSSIENEKEITCLFYAIQALCEQRCGFTELSEKSANKSRNLLSKIFDFHTNFYVACTYVYLALFESSNGRYRNARYYLHNSNFYFSEKLDANLTIDEITLAKIRIFVSFLCNNENAAQTTNDFDISSMLKELPHMFYMATGKILPNEWNFLIFGEDITSQNFTKQLRAAEAISGTAHKSLRETVPKEFIQTRGYNLCDTSFTIIVNGLRIGILSKVNCGKQMIEESALKITYCTQVDAFSLFPPNMVTYIIVATRIHLQIVKQILNSQRLNNQIGLDINGNYSNIDYFDILKRDLRALKLLESRYKRVSLIYGNFIKEIEDLLYLHQYSNNSNLNNLNTNNLNMKNQTSNILKIHETSITFFDDKNVYQAPASEIYEGKLNNIEVISKLPQSMMFKNTLRGNQPQSQQQQHSDQSSNNMNNMNNMNNNVNNMTSSMNNNNNMTNNMMVNNNTNMNNNMNMSMNNNNGMLMNNSNNSNQTNYLNNHLINNMNQLSNNNQFNQQQLMNQMMLNKQMNSQPSANITTQSSYQQPIQSIYNNIITRVQQQPQQQQVPPTFNQMQMNNNIVTNQQFIPPLTQQQSIMPQMPQISSTTSQQQTKQQPNFTPMIPHHQPTTTAPASLLPQNTVVSNLESVKTVTSPTTFIVEGGEPLLLEEEEASLFEDDGNQQDFTFTLENNNETIADLLDPFLTNEELDTIFASNAELLMDESDISFGQ